MELTAWLEWNDIGEAPLLNVSLLNTLHLKSKAQKGGIRVRFDGNEPMKGWHILYIPLH